MNLLVQDLSLLIQSNLLQILCENFRKLNMQSVNKTPKYENQTYRHIITKLSAYIIQKYTNEPDIVIQAQAIIAVMDAYELCRIEKDLQTVLTFAEKLLPQMDVSPLKCKLLSYCYYYIEEAECAEEALYIIESWDKTRYTGEMREALECYKALI